MSTNPPTTLVTVTAHAAERFRDRHRPDLAFEEARRYLALTFHTAVRLNNRTNAGDIQYQLDDVVLVVKPDRDTEGGLAIVTVLPKAENGPAYGGPAERLRTISGLPPVDAEPEPEPTPEVPFVKCHVVGRKVIPSAPAPEPAIDASDLAALTREQLHERRTQVEQALADAKAKNRTKDVNRLGMEFQAICSRLNVLRTKDAQPPRTPEEQDARHDRFLVAFYRAAGEALSPALLKALQTEANRRVAFAETIASMTKE